MKSKRSGADTTKSRIGIVKSIFTYTIIILGGVAIFALPFFHVDMPRVIPKLKQLQDNLDSKEEELEIKIKENRTSYDEGIIEASAYVANDDKLHKRLSELQEKNKKIYKSEASKTKVFDWSGPRQFWLAFGIRIPLVIYALIVSLLIAAFTPSNKSLRISLGLLQVHTWGYATYAMIWVFWMDNDFDLKTYRYVFISSSLLVGVFVTLFFHWRKMKIQRMYKVIQRQFDFMHYDVKEKGYINSLKENQYDKDTAKLVKESIENE